MLSFGSILGAILGNINKFAILYTFGNVVSLVGYQYINKLLFIQRHFVNQILLY